jgi:hypothetical protein
MHAQNKLGFLRRMLQLSRTWVMGLAMTLGVLAVPQNGHAGELLRPGTRAVSYLGGIGAGIGLNLSGAAFVIHNSVGYHFSGKSEGPLLGGDFDIYIAGGGAIFALGPRFAWDFAVSDKAFYIAPFVRAGIGIVTNGGVGFDAVFGMRLKLIFNDRIQLFSSPWVFTFLPERAGRQFHMTSS